MPRQARRYESFRRTRSPRGCRGVNPRPALCPRRYVAPGNHPIGPCPSLPSCAHTTAARAGERHLGARRTVAEDAPGTTKRDTVVGVPLGPTVDLLRRYSNPEGPQMRRSEAIRATTPVATPEGNPTPRARTQRASRLRTDLVDKLVNAYPRTATRPTCSRGGSASTDRRCRRICGEPESLGARATTPVLRRRRPSAA